MRPQEDMFKLVSSSRPERQSKQHRCSVKERQNGLPKALNGLMQTSQFFQVHFVKLHVWRIYKFRHDYPLVHFLGC